MKHLACVTVCSLASLGCGFAGNLWKLPSNGWREVPDVKPAVNRWFPESTFLRRKPILMMPSWFLSENHPSTQTHPPSACHCRYTTRAYYDPGTKWRVLSCNSPSKNFTKTNTMTANEHKPTLSQNTTIRYSHKSHFATQKPSKGCRFLF